MTPANDAWLARHRARWLRPNAHLYVRPDAHRFMRPDAGRYLQPERKHHLLPGFERASWQELLEGKAGFDPNQPRVPKGDPDGGQWTETGAGGATRNYSRARFASADKPDIGPAARRIIALEMGQRLIEAYRSENLLKDIFGGKPGAVTVTTIEGANIFGSNSSSPTYSRVDRADADRIRSRYLGSEGSIPRPGQMPSNAFYHAETTVLLRAARQNGGALSGRSVEIFADRPMCNNCDTILPFVGMELGNPTVTFVGPNGNRKTMKDGKWIDGDSE